MGASEDLHAWRLAYVCEHAVAIREDLAEQQAEGYFEQLRDEAADHVEAIRSIGELLELDKMLQEWNGTGSRDGMADVAGLRQAVARVPLACPRTGAARCSRTGSWEPQREPKRPTCALAGRDLRRDGHVQLDG